MLPVGWMPEKTRFFCALVGVLAASGSVIFVVSWFSSIDIASTSSIVYKSQRKRPIKNAPHPMPGTRSAKLSWCHPLSDTPSDCHCPSSTEQTEYPFLPDTASPLQSSDCNILDSRYPVLGNGGLAERWLLIVHMMRNV